MKINFLVFIIILLASNSVITYTKRNYSTEHHKTDQVDLNSIKSKDTDPRLSQQVNELKTEMFGTNKYRPIFKKDLEDFLCILWLKIPNCQNMRSTNYLKKIQEKNETVVQDYEMLISWSKEFLTKGKPYIFFSLINY